MNSKALRHRLTGDRSADDSDRGSMSLELVVIAPVLLLVLLLIVGLGRISHGTELVQQAALAGARAASLADTPGRAQVAADTAVQAALTDTGVSCVHATTSVDISQFHPGGQVSVTVTCTAALSDLEPTGLPDATTTSATATVPLETYRPIGNP